MTIYTHPNNKRYFEELAAKTQDVFQYDFFGVNGIKVEFSELLPERKIREVWHPPVERFVEYEASDESWMRPCGLGTVENIDEGPLFIEVDETAYQKMLASFNQHSFLALSSF